MTPEALRAKLHEYRSAHDVAIVRELSGFLAIPKPGERQSQHPSQRGASPGHDDGARNRRAAARVAQRSAAGGVRGATRAGRDARRSCSTRTTTGSRSIRRSGPRRRGSRCCATRPPTPAGRSFRFRRAAGRSRANGGSTPARRATTRRRSSRCSPRIDALKAAGVRAVGQPQVLLRGRGGGRVGPPARAARAERRAAPRRRVAVRRRAGASVAPAADRLRRARRDRRRAHGVRPVARAAQRPLRQLGAESRSRCSRTSSRACATTTAGFSSRTSTTTSRRSRRPSAARIARHSGRSIPRCAPSCSSAPPRRSNAPLVERIMLPALNLRGIRGGNVGATASNTIPTEATGVDRLPSRAATDAGAHSRSSSKRTRGAQATSSIDHTPTAAERMAHARILKVTWEAGYPATRVVDGLAALARRDSRDAGRRSARRSSPCRRSAEACRCTRSSECCTRRSSCCRS